jgi:hypothetical protein
VSEADKGEAARAFARAEAAFGAGDLEGARVAIEASYSLLPNATTALTRAFVLGALGRDREALAAYLVASDLSPQPDEQARIDAGLARHAKALSPPMGWLVVVARPPDARVTVAGASFAAPRAIALPAGRHEVVVRSPGFQPATTLVVVQAGQPNQLKMALVATPAPLPISAPAAASSSESLPWVLMGTGGGLLVIGASMNLWALVRADDTARYAHSMAGVTVEQRRVQHEAAAADARIGRTLGYVFYGLGGAVAATGLVVWLTSAGDRVVTPTPAVIGGAAPGLTVHGSF